MPRIFCGPCQSWTYHHVIVFFLTFFGYALFHANRKTFSNVKTVMEDVWTSNRTDNEQHKPFFPSKNDAENFLGILDTIFMSFYAIGLYLSGFLADRFNMRYVLSAGMMLSAISMIMFGVVSEWFHIYNEAYYIFFWILNGLFQSTGWPVTITVMENWFGKSSRGVMFGIWGSCTSVGNIIGMYLTVSVLNYGYQFAFLLCASVLFFGGVIIIFTLKTSPTEIGLPTPDELTNHMKRTDIQDSLIEERDALLKDEEAPMPSGETIICSNDKAVGFFRALFLPGVLLYSLAYACLKLVNYSFFFWLPYYLKNKFDWSDSDADELSVWYDVGGIIGAIASGIVTDQMGRRSIVVIIMLAISPVTLYFYSQSEANKRDNALLMLLVGIFINGVANILSTAISADLGRQEVLQGNTKALATVTGIVDGTGSAGAAIGQILVPQLNIASGWNSVFILFIVMTILTGIFILPIVVHDIKYYIKKWREPHNVHLQFGSSSIEDDDDAVVSS